MDTCCDKDEPQNHFSEQKKSDIKRLYCIVFHLYEIYSEGKPREIESKPVIAWS